MPALKKILLVLLPLATIALVVWLALPEYRRIAPAKTAREQAAGELEQKRALLAKVRYLEKQFRSVELAARKVTDIVPSSPNVPQLLVEFPALVLRHGMTLSRFSLGSAKAGDPVVPRAGATPPSEAPYLPLNVELGLKGTYEAFKVFLAAAERDLRLMDVNRIAFGGADEGGLHDFSLTLSVYYGLSL